MFADRFIAALARLKGAFSGRYTTNIMHRQDNEAFYVDGPAKISVRRASGRVHCLVHAPETTSIIREEVLGDESPVKSEGYRKPRFDFTDRKVSIREWIQTFEQFQETLGVHQIDVLDPELEGSLEAQVILAKEIYFAWANGDRSDDLYHKMKDFCRG